MSRTLRRAAAATAAAVLAGLAAPLTLPATPAAAHVTVEPARAEQGGYGVLTFRVPNERDDAATTTVEMVLPPDAPLPSVAVRPVPGWTAAVADGPLPAPVEVEGGTITQGVTGVTWTATSAATAIQPGQYLEFAISGGPFPERDTLVLKALQTYSDGQVVRWIEEPVDGQEEPEFPAVVVALVPPAEAGAGSTGEAEGVAEADGATADTGESGGGGLGTLLGAAGLVAGLAGLVLGGAAYRRTRSRP